MRELKELKLPQLVEQKKAERESSGDSSVMGHSQQLSQSSIVTDASSPTFSGRGRSTVQSSASSLPSSPTMLSSTDFGSGKRPLTDLKEEPQERDEDSEMVDSFAHEDSLGKPFSKATEPLNI